MLFGRAQKVNAYHLLLTAVLCLFMVTCAVQNAQAATISFMDEHLLSITDWTDTLTVPQFDPTQGTLSFVKVTFEASLLSDMTLDNDNPQGVTVVGNVDVAILGSFVGLGPLNVAPSGTTGPVNLGPDDHVPPPPDDQPGDGGPDEQLVQNIMGSDMRMETILPANPDFLAFIGNGTLSTVGLGTLAGFGVSGGGGNIDISVSTDAAAKLTVEYTFQPDIPEPATMLLVGTGLIGLAAGFRRKFKK